MNTTRPEKYVSLIRQFLDHQVSAEFFERQYLDMFKNETPGMSNAVFSPLDKLFAAADAFCPDPSLRSEEDLDEDQLRQEAQSALTMLLEQEMAVESFDREKIEKELQRCHAGLMTVWNQYRNQMHCRGYRTEDATQEVAVRVLEHLGEFRGQTKSSFCAWSQTILRRWILEKLRRRRPDPLPSNDDLANDQQDRPSEVFQKEMRQAVYDLTRAAITDADRALIELRFEEKLSLQAVTERLQRDYPQLWNENQLAWDTETKINNECKLARRRFDEEAGKIHKMLEGGVPDESSTGE